MNMNNSRRFSNINGSTISSTSQAASSSQQPRHSIAGRPSLGPGRRTYSNSIGQEFTGLSISSQQFGQRPSSVPRPSLDRNSISRRSSVQGKQSLSGPIGKDPRPIRDKNFQANCTKNLLEFLMRVGYPHPISQKLLTAPSAKDFQQIFKFLYSHLDPTYEFGKKFEEEVPGLMKGLRYPFAAEISKSQLYAVGSMHAWPSLLAMLAWMVELIQCCDELNNQHSGAMDLDDPIGADSQVAEKIFFDYLCKTYKLFLAGSDNFDAMVADLGNNFERKNENILAETSDLSRIVEHLEIELSTLSKEEPPLAKVQRDKAIYLGDIEKFKKFISHLNLKKQKFFESIERLEEDIILIEKELQDVEIHRVSLQAQVDAQDICPEDIDRMNADKDQLVRTLESLTQTKDEASRIFWDRELQVQKRLDAVEKAVQEYNFICERIGYIPRDAIFSNGQDFEISFNPHASKLDGILSVDLKQSILVTLNSMREEYHATIHQAQDKLICLQETLDRLGEALADKQDEVSQVEEKIKRVVQAYVTDKEIYQNENRKNGTESDELEQTIQRLRSDNSASLLHSQQRLQRVTIEYDQLVSRISEEKERIGNEIFRILEELINFKTNIETTLGDLESSYVKELPKE